MGREGWVYALVFLTILGVGAVLIVPRLLRLRRPDEAETPTAPPTAAVPPLEDPIVPPVVHEWVRVRVRGPRGVLLGPLKEVHGAEVRTRPDPDGATAPVVDFHVRPTSDVVHFGAAGHQWRAVDVSTLLEAATVVLPEAAPTVIVRVREPDGRPAPGVPVRIHPTPPGPPIRTDGGGTVVIDDAAPGLLVVEVGGSERRGPTLRLLAGRDQDVKVVLQPAWQVRGRVLEADGRPVPGARIEGMGAGGALGACPGTDGEGRFTWKGPVAGTLALRITVPGRAVSTVEVMPPARGPLVTDLGDVHLDHASATLEGRVLAASAGGDVRVRVEPAVAAVLRELFGPRAVLDLPRTVTPDEDGTFRVPDVPTDIPLRVSVRGAGLPFDDIMRLGPGVVSLDPYTPPPGLVLHGRLVDEVLNAPAAGTRLRVSLRPVDGDVTLPDDREVFTDRAGRFRIDGFPPRRVYVRAYVPGRRTLLHEVRLPLAAPLVLALDAPVVPEHLTESRRITGLVVDDEGRSLAGVTVRAAGRTTRTEADGTFRLEDVEGFGDEVLLTAGYEPGIPLPAGVDPTPYVAGVRRHVVPGPEAVKIVLARAASLRLRALDGLDDEPLSFLHVILRTEDGQVVVDRAVALEDGTLVLDGLLPVGGSLALFSHRHRLTIAVLLEAGTERDFSTLRLARGMHITGRVVDGEGAPIAGARLGGLEAGWLHTQGGDPTLARELDLRRAVSGADGGFELDGFDPRRPALLAAWAPGYAPAARRVVLEEFQDDVHVNLTVRLQRGGRLSVELLEAGTDRPISGALFDLENARNGSDYLDLLRRGMLGGPVGSDEDWRLASEHFLVEREDGRYRLGPIEPGPYEAWVDRPGYTGLTRKITVLDPADAIVSVTDGTTRSLTDSLYMTWQMDPEE